MSAAEVTWLKLVLFSAGGVSFGVEAGEAENIAAYSGESGDDLFWFHDLIDYGDDSISYSSPTIISIKTEGPGSKRIIIDSMEDIAEFSQNDIRPFPPLFEQFALRKGMWGILIMEEKLVLLMDFGLMMRNRHTIEHNISEGIDQ